VRVGVIVVDKTELATETVKLSVPLANVGDSVPADAAKDDKVETVEVALVTVTV